MRGLSVSLSWCLVALALVLTPPAEAGEARVVVAGNSFSVPITSLKERPYKTVTRQQFDYSCGSAAVATLLTYHYERRTNETEVFTAMWEAGDQEKIRKLGFSLLDMKKFLADRGYKASGYRIPLDKLARGRVPAIVLVNIKGYKHFVVIKGIRGDEVIVGDPALGVKVYSREAFEKIWANNIVFVIVTRKELARKHFNDDADWALHRRAPFGMAVRGQDLEPITLLLPLVPFRNEF